MNDLARSDAPSHAGTGSWFTARLRRALHERLRALEGQLLIEERGEPPVILGSPEPGRPPLRVQVQSPEFYSYAGLGGAVGLGEAWMLGLWTTPDLVPVVRLLMRNASVLDGLDGGLARLRQPLLRLLYRRRRNSRDGSRLNIAAHYDLGNDFFRLFLDRSLTYSAAMYADGAESLEAAQERKLDTVCRKLDLRPGERLVEIGSGWGALAIHAATRFGARVTTTTLSKEQYAVAVERVEAAGLAGRVTVLLRDYRDLEGRFDKLVSIEMIEAVGHEFHPHYLKACECLLEPDGLALIQAITCPDQRYEAYRGSSDFIRRYVFPGGLLPSTQRLLDVTARHTRLRLAHHEDFAQDYARTLAEWRRRFWERQAEVRALGYSPEFVRMWDFYLAICEAGFAERYNGVVQLVLAMPGNRGEAVRA
jgi:cyclopropane-fatty-acyl-phospholipid synthase